MSTDKDIHELAAQITKCSKNASQFLLDKQFEDAKKDFEEAFRISKQIKDPFTIRKCAFNLGAVYIRLCQASKGLEYLELAIPPENNTDRVSNNGDLYFNMALGYEMVKDFQNAVVFFKKALIEYRLFEENNSSKMFIETLEKLVKNARYVKRYEEAAEWNGELCQIYTDQGNDEKILVSMGEQIVQLRKANEKEKCLAICDQIINKLDGTVITPLTANMLNDVGLILSQYERFQQAERCYIKALTMVKALPMCEKLTAILLQNLGALCNLTGTYTKSIEYHSQAADKFEQLKNHINEGHCYANLGYAYNQIGDVDNAMESFVLALRKAKDNGDPHSEWQVSESLGALCCNLGNLDIAIKYYTDAFKTITKDVNANTSAAEDRLQAKLFTLMKKEAEKQQTSNQQQIRLNDAQNNATNTQPKSLSKKKSNVVKTHPEKTLEQQETVNYIQVPPVQQPIVIINDTETLQEDQNLLTHPPESNDAVLSPYDNSPKSKSKTRKELIKRRLKVRRSGSLKEFDKVARGVYVSMNSDVIDALQAEKRSVHSSDFSFTDAYASSSESISSDSSDASSITSKGSKKNIFELIKEKAEKKLENWRRDNDSPVQLKSHISVVKRQTGQKVLVTHDSILQIDEDRQQVQELYRQQLEQDRDNGPSTSKNKKLKKPKSKDSSSPSTSSSTSSSSSSTDISSQSDASGSDSEKDSNFTDKHDKKRSGPPTLPINSAPQTLINTYENPEPHYTEIEFMSSSKVNTGEKKGQSVVTHYAEIDFNKRKTSMEIGPNYFDDDNLVQAKNADLQSTSGTVYETIEQPPDEGVINSQENPDLSQLSRAERERYLYNQHLKSQHVELPDKKDGEKDKKSSKVCNVM